MQVQESTGIGEHYIYKSAEHPFGCGRGDGCKNGGTGRGRGSGAGGNDYGDPSFRSGGFWSHANNGSGAGNIDIRSLQNIETGNGHGH